MKRRHGSQLLEAVKEEAEKDDYDVPVKKRAAPKGPKPKLTGRAANVDFRH